MFSCHKMGHAILSNMVEINQKTYPKDKKTFKSEYQRPNFLSGLWSSLNEKLKTEIQKQPAKKALKPLNSSCQK